MNGTPEALFGDPMTGFANEMILSDPWVFAVSCLAIVMVLALVVIRMDLRTFRQRRRLRRSKKQLRAQLKKDKQQLCRFWENNPAEQCAATFNRFKNPIQKVAAKQVADDVDSAIENASRLFDEDFLTRYASDYDTLVAAQFEKLAKAIAVPSTTNTAFIRGSLAEGERGEVRDFHILIGQALDQGRIDYDQIRMHLQELRQNASRFRRMLVPGFFSQISGMVVGALTGGVLGAMGIDSSFVISKSAQFTAQKVADWKEKSDEDFGNGFCEILSDLPVACERMSASVRQSLTNAFDRCLEQRLGRIDAILGGSGGVFAG